MRKLLLVAASVLGISLIIYFSQNRQKASISQVPQTQQNIETASEEAETVDISASFEIYTNGTKRIFTASMYHNLSPDVYIASDNPNLVNVKKAGITWDDFFKTLPMELSKDCLVTGTKQTFCSQGEKRLRFFLNGQENPDALDEIINDGDTLRVTYEL